MRYVTPEDVAAVFRGRSVAIVGSAPSVLENAPGFVDSHDLVCRVNNYKTGPAQGKRCDVHYSFYGNSIRKTAEALIADGVKLCMCKCPNDKPIDSEWHVRMNKPLGVDFRYIYQARASWWFCDTFVPSTSRFLASFELLHKHIPTTGFSAILDILSFEPRSVYLTGFDFFTSGKHNVDELWRPGDPQDPIGHSPWRELDWLCQNAHRYPLEYDAKIRQMILERQAVLMTTAA
jgi:hypothetical protein